MANPGATFGCGIKMSRSLLNLLLKTVEGNSTDVALSIRQVAAYLQTETERLKS